MGVYNFGMKLTFLGATGTVTGSKYLLEGKGHKILIDCGLFQGYKELRLRNWDKLPVNPAEIDAVLLTHAHLDHSGYLPLLIKNGFRGKIYCTHPTKDLCALLLPDSGYLNEEDAKRANKYGYTKHKPALPLYTKADGEKALEYFSPIDFNKEYTLKGGFTFSFHYAGHILGAAGIIIRHEGRSAFFSGDIGRLEDMVMRSPESIPAADYLVIESTYGDRLHDKESPLDKLASVVKRTIKRGGVVLIPSFAVGRAQSILYYINELKKQDRIPSNLPVYLDSPMAINATEILCKYADFHKLSQNECNKVCDAAEYVHTPDESKALDHSNVPSIIISASGMATGGRILHHLKRFAPEDKNTLLFTGFQAGGTRGDRIVRGESKVKMHGEMVQINAEVDVMHNASAHADYEEIMTLLSSVKHKPIKVFITHGEPASASAMEERIEEKLGWECTIPKYLQTENL